MSQEKAIPTLNQILNAAKRFPVVVGLIPFYMASGIVFSQHGLDGVRSNVIANTLIKCAFYYPILASLLSISLKLYQENSAKYKRWISPLFHGILFGLSFFLALFANDLGEDKFVQLLLTFIMVLVLGIFFVAGSLLKNGKRMVDFELKTSGAFVSALVVSFCLFCLLVIGGAGVEFLFSCKMDKDILGLVVIVILLFVFPLVFLSKFPYLHQCKEKVKIEKTDKVIYNVLGALTLLYFLALYVYMAKILFTWTLPQGTLVYAVSVAAIVAEVLCTTLYAFVYCDENASVENAALVKLYQRLLKIIPAAMFPLLVLMTVAIVRRVSDYGLTVPRLYAILLNAYFYVLFVDLLQNKKIGRLSASDICAVVFFVSLCFVPFSAFSTDGFHSSKSVKEAEANQTKKLYFNSLSRSVMPTPPGYSSVVYVSRNLSPENVKLQNDTISFRLYYGLDSFKNYNGEGDEDVQFAEFRMPTSMLLDSARYFRKERQEDLGTPFKLENENSVLFLTKLEFMMNTKDSMAVSIVKGVLFIK